MNPSCNLFILLFLLSSLFVRAQTKNLPDSNHIKFLNLPDSGSSAETDSWSSAETDSWSSAETDSWKPVLDRIGEKRLVFLGEFNHGSSEVFKVQNDLIRQLHEQKQYNVVLFESGIGEMGAIALTRNERTPEQLTYGFFSGWRTRERVDLMVYLREKGVRIGGFDVQRTGSVFTDFLSIKLDELDYFESLEQRFIDLKKKLSDYQTNYDSVEEESTALILDYRELLESLQPDEFYEERGLQGRITYLQYMLDWVKTKDWNARWKQRDAAMAENIRWWLGRLPESSKIIVLAHNYHISKYNKNEQVMGEFLAGDLGSEIYSIGVFGGSGAFSNNSGNREEISPPDNIRTDIKDIIKRAPAERVFLDIKENNLATAPWLYSEIISRDTFNDLAGSEEINLSKWFDALILLKTITPANKIN